ncbi:hypothetical protein BRC83_02460 [Halobacteriales archaeon QS_1_68_17]|nr:MAG: hypothetical protein BRC83_02460 [Halobacteriales archaeon QS_1_68_17]
MSTKTSSSAMSRSAILYPAAAPTVPAAPTMLTFAMRRVSARGFVKPADTAVGSPRRPGFGAGVGGDVGVGAERGVFPDCSARIFIRDHRSKGNTSTGARPPLRPRAGTCPGEPGPNAGAAAPPVHPGTMTDHVDDPRTRRPLVEYVTDPVVVIEDGVVRRTNAALSSVFGYDGDELAGTAFSSLVHPDQRDRFEALLDDVAPAGDRPVEGRFRLRDAEGTWLSVELALVAPGGDRPACVVTVRDISRLRRRERTLAELHRAAADIEACENIGAVCERAVAAAENILDHDWCGIFFPEGEYFVFQAVSSGLNMEPGDRGIRVDEGLGGKVYETGEPLVLGTREEHVDAAPINELDDIPFESILTVPVGEFGVFQAISSEQHAYDEEDLEFLQLLLSHVRGALTQLEREARLRERERELRRKNERLEEFAGVVTHDLRNPLQIAGGPG